MAKPKTSKIIAMMAITSAITGLGFLLTAPVTLIPGAVQLRILAFLPCVFGILFGWKTGFVAGGIGNLLWAILGGYFNPATPIFDLIGVGLTGAIPGYFVDPKEGELTWKKLGKATLWSYISVGIIMIPIVAIGFELVGAAPFTGALYTLAVSDLPPIIGVPLVLKILVPALKKRGLLEYRF